MTTTEIIQTSVAILAGAAFLVLIGYLTFKFLGGRRDYADEKMREHDGEFERHINPKK